MYHTHISESIDFPTMIYFVCMVAITHHSAFFLFPSISFNVNMKIMLPCSIVYNMHVLNIKRLK